MKRLGILFITVIFYFQAFSQNCIIGNQDTTNFTHTTGNFSPNHLLGTHFTLETTGTLISLNLIGKNTGSQVQMALYDDSIGKPNNLISYTGITTVGAGVISLPVAPITLQYGDYWVMAIYDLAAVHTYKTLLTPERRVFYSTVEFGSALPLNASNFKIYKGQDFTYFMEVICLNSIQIEDQNRYSDFVISYNHDSQYINVSNSKLSRYTIELHDQLGSLLKRQYILTSNARIDVSNLPKGVYFVSIDSRSRKKIVVQ